MPVMWSTGTPVPLSILMEEPFDIQLTRKVQGSATHTETEGMINKKRRWE